MSIENNRNELRNLNGQHVNPEIESDSEETYKLIDDFINMVEHLEKVPRKKFRIIADKDLHEISEKIEVVKRNKQNNLHLLFNGPKSFVENWSSKILNKFKIEKHLELLWLKKHFIKIVKYLNDEDDKHCNQCEQKFEIVIIVKKHWQDEEWQTLKPMWTKIIFDIKHWKTC